MTSTGVRLTRRGRIVVALALAVPAVLVGMFGPWFDAPSSAPLLDCDRSVGVFATYSVVMVAESGLCLTSTDK